MIINMRKALLFVILFLVSTSAQVSAQCAMCRTTLENNYSNGDPGIAAGINTGILYLLAMPYLVVMILGYLWYKTSKNASKKFSDSAAVR
jgi:hypothetical protein